MAKLLGTAADEGNLAEVRRLLRDGAPVDGLHIGTTPLNLASRKNHPRVVKELLEHGADVDAIGPKQDRSALFNASGDGYIGVVKVLLEHNANPNLIDTEGMTALFVASQWYSRNIIRVVKLFSITALTLIL